MLLAQLGKRVAHRGAGNMNHSAEGAVQLKDHEDRA